MTFTAWCAQEPQRELVTYLRQYYVDVRHGATKRNRYLDSLITRLIAKKPLTPRQLTVGYEIMSERGGPKPLLIGVFNYQGRIVVMRPNKSGTASYANRVVECPPRVNQYGVTIKHELEYAKDLTHKIREEHRLNGEALEAFLVLYGRCICGRSLKAEKSVRRMMGPRCWKKYGRPVIARTSAA
jgi:hypothetical protein